MPTAIRCTVQFGGQDIKNDKLGMLLVSGNSVVFRYHRLYCIKFDFFWCVAVI